ncbi:hypothetical protein Q8A67_015135 [Cirrhinus molitorella]|uniref:Uncharacterized protein n=1 Tax=Cirrhinus molitorella TaxID=172907 RepID=A0AA88PHW6_9TELE|nr:hypothetical protein Q8A67_015135 [Cirrhinus molitorella]
MGHRCGVDDGPGVDPGMTGASEPWDGRLTVCRENLALIALTDRKREAYCILSGGLKQILSCSMNRDQCTLHREQELLLCLLTPVYPCSQSKPELCHWVSDWCCELSQQDHHAADLFMETTSHDNCV